MNWAPTMRTSMVFAAAALTALAAFADPPALQFSRRFNEFGQAIPLGVKTDAAGNAYLCGRVDGGTFPLLHPIETTGSMFLTKLDSGGNIVYSTMLGTQFVDAIGDCTVDRDGNAYVVGTTGDARFPITPDAVQKTLIGSRNAFVMKIDPTGQRILYATYLGQGPTDTALAIALDAYNAMYVAGITNDSPTHATTFVTKLVPDGSFIQYAARLDELGASAMRLVVTNLTEATLLLNTGGNSRVIKLNAAGDRVVYRSVMPATVSLSAIASDANGFIWVAGASNTAALPTPDAAQAQPAGHVYYRSEDGGTTWSPGGLEVGQVNQIIAASGALYAATDQGLFTSTDTGRTWTRLFPDLVRQVVADPSAPGTLYILRAGAGQISKTTDGGTTWQSLEIGAPPTLVLMGLTLDPSHPSTVYVGAQRLYRSDDGGATWRASDALPGNGILAIAVDPANSSMLYLATSPQYVGGGPAPSIPITPSVIRSTDGGRSFQNTSLVNSVLNIAVDTAHPGTAYAVGTLLYRTTDYGAHWTDLRGPQNPNGYMLGGVSVDASGAVIVASYDGRLFRSDDGGTSLVPVSDFAIYGTTGFAVADGVIHLAGRRGLNSLIAKLDLAGNISYATFWGGRAYDQASGIALDDAGNVYVSGGATSPDFPQRDGVRAYSGGADSFVVKFDPSGNVLYSTLWGGSGDEYIDTVGVAPDGRVFVTGITASGDYPAALRGSVFLFSIR
jgi:photosystem II stability/assembly factor-like uncharacterized protein